jgi:uncharacterized membrane protein YphA (DoxX/SURF4 family)
MQGLAAKLDQAEVHVTGWLIHYSITLLRIGLGLVFFWFGVLKFFPGASPAQELALNTTEVLTFGMVPAGVNLVVLATLECAIGLGLVTGKFLRLTLVLLVFQMLGAWSPLFLFPGEAFTQFPYAPTLEGQYIIKNIVLIGAALVIGATLRGGHIIEKPEILLRRDQSAPVTRSRRAEDYKSYGRSNRERTRR